MATHGELIAADSPAGSVKELIGADAVVYQSLADLRHLMARIGVGICDACFSNEYPSSGGQSFASVEEARSNA